MCSWFQTSICVTNAKAQPAASNSLLLTPAEQLVPLMPQRSDTLSVLQQIRRHKHNQLVWLPTSWTKLKLYFLLCFSWVLFFAPSVTVYQYWYITLNWPNNVTSHLCYFVQTTLANLGVCDRLTACSSYFQKQNSVISKSYQGYFNV